MNQPDDDDISSSQDDSFCARRQKKSSVRVISNSESEECYFGDFPFRLFNADDFATEIDSGGSEIEESDIEESFEEEGTSNKSNENSEKTSQDRSCLSETNTSKKSDLGSTKLTEARNAENRGESQALIDNLNHLLDSTHEDLWLSSFELKPKTSPMNKNNNSRDNIEQNDDIQEAINNDRTPVARTSHYRSTCSIESNDDEANTYIIEDSDEEREKIVEPKVKLKAQSQIVSQKQYKQQKAKIVSIEVMLHYAKCAMRVVKLVNLPDRGKKLVEREKFLNNMLQHERLKLANMAVYDVQFPNTRGKQKYRRKKSRLIRKP